MNVLAGGDRAAWTAEQFSDDEYDGRYPSSPGVTDDAVWNDASQGDHPSDDDYYGSSHGDYPSDDDEADQADDVDDDADEAGRDDGADEAGDHGRQARFDPKVVTFFGGAVLLAVVIALVLAVVFYSGGPAQAPAERSVADPGAVVPSATAAPTTVPPTNDRALPYTADARESCPDAGSTPAQTMSGSDPHNAFQCVRAGIDGQFVDFDLSKTHVITGITFTPGWIGKDASGVMQWSQHRVVTLVQFTFNDTENTIVTHDTKNVHGETVVPIKRVMASKVRMLIRMTSRPPADAPATTSGLAGPGPAFGAPKAFGPATQNSDPVDSTFAISRLSIIGHEPL